MGRKANYDEWVEHILSLNIGMTKEEILNFFYESQLCELKDIGWVSEFNKDND